MRPFSPMPLVRGRDPFDDRHCIFEPKLDGFRAIAHIDRGRCRLISRNGHPFRSWPGLATAIATSAVSCGLFRADGQLARFGGPCYDSRHADIRSSSHESRPGAARHRGCEGRMP